MKITLDIPDEFAPQFTRPGQDVARTVLEDAAVEAYRMHRITGYQLRGLLKARQGWSTPWTI